MVVGNSWTTLSWFGAEPERLGAVPTAEIVRDSRILEELTGDPLAVRVVVSVVPPVEAAIARRFPQAEFVTAEQAPMAVLYGDPGTLGPDRLANALAARELAGAPVLAVDCGTATTFTLVDLQGRLAGGAIAIGLKTARDALAARTARLPAVDLVVPPAGPATDTAGALRVGLVHGHAGLIRHLCQMLAPGAPILMTGGSSGLLAPLVPGAQRVEHLTALGGKIFHDRRRQGSERGSIDARG